MPVPEGTFLESGGLVTIEAEQYAATITTSQQAWITSTTWTGYTGTAYVQAAPDLGALYATEELTGSPELRYDVRFLTPGTDSLWLYGAGADAAGDSVHISLEDTFGLQEPQALSLSGFAPRTWSWANSDLETGEPATLTVAAPGLYMVSNSQESPQYA